MAISENLLSLLIEPTFRLLSVAFVNSNLPSGLARGYASKARTQRMVATWEGKVRQAESADGGPVVFSFIAEIRKIRWGKLIGEAAFNFKGFKTTVRLKGALSNEYDGWFVFRNVDPASTQQGVIVFKLSAGGDELEATFASFCFLKGTPVHGSIHCKAVSRSLIALQR